MAVKSDRVTFWFGCNMLRHAEMIRLSQMLLERVGYDVNTVGGPAYCCGTAHDHQPRAASNMAARTVGKFNDAASKDDRGTVVTWCPSCHMHMFDIMAPGNETTFQVNHITELLAARADRLAPLMTQPVPVKVLLHRHLGFATHVRVNELVDSVLRRIPGIELVDGPAQPGHMCSALGPVPGALAASIGGTWEAAVASGCDTVCTIFHSCHREFAPLDGRDGVRLLNWVQLVARAMGIGTADAYVGWRHGGAPDVAAIEKVGPDLYQSLIESELRKPGVVPAKSSA